MSDCYQTRSHTLHNTLKKQYFFLTIKIKQFNPTFLYAQPIPKCSSIIVCRPTADSDRYSSKYSKFNELLLDIQKDKIISKLVHVVEYTLRKMYSITKNKSVLFEKIIAMNSVIMLYLLKRQRNFETYMSPVNDCILVINQKFYSKFLSSNITENIFHLLIENTK